MTKTSFFLLSFWPNLVLAQSLAFFSPGQWVRLGDLDVPGNQITVEALIKMDEISLTKNIVSKHTDPSNVNYLLRPLTFELSAYITGDTGKTQFLQMWNPFVFDTGHWYHVAGTYDGTAARYYVDGCLIIQLPFSGNLVQNDLEAVVANQSFCQCEQFLGKIDEVRIWNVCRSENEIRANMLSLPNPLAQPALMAYYKFDNSLVNAQGNPARDASFFGNISFSSDQAAIQPYAITMVETANADCAAASNGSLVISTNRPGSQFSLNNTDFQTSDSFSNLYPGNIKVYAKSSGGCVLDTLIYLDHNDWKTQTTVETTICQGETYSGYGLPGIYSDVLKAANGCDSIRTLRLTVKPVSVKNLSATICTGESYDFNGKFVFDEGLYSDTLLNYLGCDSLVNLHLNIANKPFLGNDTSICNENEFIINSPFENTLWPDRSISKNFNAKQSGMYWASAIDQNGCTVTDTISVNFNIKAYLPNIFSPNDDGLHECFAPAFSDLLLSNYKFSIFDRWGNLMFLTTDPSACWTGESMGKMCSPGVYFYLITLETDFCKKTQIKGPITLLK